MSTLRLSFWIRWLLVANILAAILGCVLTFAHNALPWQFVLKTLKADIGYTAEMNWLLRFFGASKAGFHLLISIIIYHAFPQKLIWAYHAIWVAVSFVFLVELSFSLYHRSTYFALIFSLPIFAIHLFVFHKIKKYFWLNEEIDN